MNLSPISHNIAARPSLPVLHLVDFCEGPKQGLRQVAMLNPIGPENGWSSLAAAQSAVRLLTNGDNAPAAVIYTHKGDSNFYASSLVYLLRMNSAR